MDNFAIIKHRCSSRSVVLVASTSSVHLHFSFSSVCDKVGPSSPHVCVLCAITVFAGMGVHAWRRTCESVCECVSVCVVYTKQFISSALHILSLPVAARWATFKHCLGSPVPLMARPEVNRLPDGTVTAKPPPLSSSQNPAPHKPSTFTFTTWNPPSWPPHTTWSAGTPWGHVRSHCSLPAL